MRVRSGLAALALFASVSASAMAAPATPEQAAKIASGLQAYLSAEPGVVAVTPNGEAYDLKLDLNPLFAKHKSADFSGSISPFTMKLMDQGGGKWQVMQDEGVTYKFTMPGSETSGSLGNIKSTSTYDEALGTFSSGMTEFTGFSQEQTITEPGKPSMRSSATMASGRYETKAQAGTAGGVDGTVQATIEGHSQSMTFETQTGSPPSAITITSAKGVQDGAFKGLRVAPLLKLLAWGVKNSGASDINTKQPELKALIQEALPAFDNLKATLAYEDIKAATPMGPVALAKFGGVIDVNGLVAQGQLQETLTFEGLTLPPGIVPPFAADLVPQKLTVDFKATDFNLGETSKVFFSEVDFTSKGDLPAELSAKLLGLLLPTGQVTLTTSGTTAVAKAYDLKVDGSMKAGPNSVRPVGNATVKLTGFDNVVKALQAAPPELGLQQGMAGLVVAKGMAKQEGDQLTWVIEATPEGGVLVNGIDVMKMGGGG